MFSSASFERDTILEPLCSQLIFQVESIKNDNISSNKCPGFNVVIWLLYLYSFQCHRLDKNSKRMEQTCSEREETVLFFYTVLTVKLFPFNDINACRAVCINFSLGYQ